MSQIKHFYKNYQEAIHVAANRDEIGMYESSRHPFVFYKGYVFEGGRWFYNSMELAIRMGNNPFLGIDFNKHCIAFFDKKNKKTAVKDCHWYTSVLADATPFKTDNGNDSVYKLYEIPIESIFDEKNKVALAKQRLKNLVKKWIDVNIGKYNVLYTNSKIFHNYDYYINESRDIEYAIEKLDEEYKNFQIKEYLFSADGIDVYCNNKLIHIPEPTVEDIIKASVFTEEQKKHIDMCDFYTKFCYKEGFSWNEVKKSWGTGRIKEIEETALKRRENIKKLRIECEQITQRNRREAIDEVTLNFSVESWRESTAISNGNTFEYKAYFVNNLGLRESHIRKEYFPCNFKNVQLKLYKDKVYTSKGAIVDLEDAKKLFNWLYTNYIDKRVEFNDFSKKNIKISWYTLRHIAHLDKKTDEGESLGYKDWKIQIGCHAIWMEEVKEFCRYYHLDNEVVFNCNPLNINKDGKNKVQ